MPERPTGRAPRLRAGRGLRSLRPRAQKVVETKVQTCDGAAHKSSRLESFSKLGRIFRNNTTKFGGIQNETWAEAKTGRGGCGGGPGPRRATCRAAPRASGGASRAKPPPDVPPDRTAPPSTSTRPRPPPAPPPPPPLHLLPRLALEGGHGLPAQLLRGRRHLALRVIPRRLPTRPLVAPHTHIPHRTPRLVRLSPQHTPSPSVRGPALSQCEWLA